MRSRDERRFLQMPRKHDVVDSSSPKQTKKGERFSYRKRNSLKRKITCCFPVSTKLLIIPSVVQVVVLVVLLVIVVVHHPVHGSTNFGGSHGGIHKNHNAYHILNVQKDASQEEIRKQYRKLCLKYHPDKNVGESNQKEYESKFKQIQQAYDHIGDPTKRRQYDDELRLQQFYSKRNRSNYGSGSSTYPYSSTPHMTTDELFEQFYRQHRMYHQGRPRNRKRVYVNGVDISHLFPNLFNHNGASAASSSEGLNNNNPFFFGREPPVSVYVQNVEIPLQDLYTGKEQHTFIYGADNSSSVSVGNHGGVATSVWKRRLVPFRRLVSRYVAAYRGGLLQMLVLQGIASSAILALRRTRIPFAIAYMVGYIHMNIPKGPWMSNSSRSQEQGQYNYQPTRDDLSIFKTKLKKGWKDGTKLTFRHMALQGGYVVTFIIKEKPHPLYKRIGNDLYTEVILSSSEYSATAANDSSDPTSSSKKKKSNKKSNKKKTKHKQKANVKPSSTKRQEEGHQITLPPLDEVHGSPIIFRVSDKNFRNSSSSSNKNSEKNNSKRNEEEDDQQQTIVLKGKGWPKKDGTYGDLIVTIKLCKKKKVRDGR